MRFVDTNILLYAVSTIPEEAEKGRLAQSVLTDTDIVLSTQVLQEFYTQATRPSRLGALSHLQAVGHIRSLQRFHIEEITVDLVLMALEIRQRFNISYWDAAILAAARTANCDIVYSEDFSHTQDYDGIRIQNPFTI